MLNLLDYSPLKAAYASIYDSLSQMRELFHQTGRFDDSNAKLDEVAKLFAVYLAYRRNLIPSFPASEAGNRSRLIKDLRDCFDKTIRIDYFRNQDGTSIFGSSPSLLLRNGDEPLAESLVTLVRNSVDAALANRDVERPFDVLNEAFGHFVRDNFRSHIEDAQYMTPPEVVEFMVDMALAECAEDLAATSDPFLVVDPTCGVGSFLTSFYSRTRGMLGAEKRVIQLVGQDKVERMVRLTTINLALFEAVDHRITLGNSLSRDSPLTDLNNKVDLVLTNPPFGAMFDENDIESCGAENLPFFSRTTQAMKRVDSALLFVDRNLALLKDGGRLLIVLPDSVVSARGVPGMLRREILRRAVIKAVIELPSVTFAQAGTRTKTCILYLVKKPTVATARTVFLAKSENLGFEVSSRKGTQIKISSGSNDLPSILSAFQRIAKQESGSQTEVLLQTPSCVRARYEEFASSSWTPNHYNTSRLQSISQLESSHSVDPVPLSELVSFQSESRKHTAFRDGFLFVSVLHVIGEGMLDIGGIKQYRPKTPGIVAMPGEILLSKINPRIPRVLVLPDFGKTTLCSSEFEVMSVKRGVDPYTISYLLLLDSVQQQIRSLTSGTSASHNRIRTSELVNVLVPIPKAGSEYEAKLKALMKQYRHAVDSLVISTLKIHSIRAEELTYREKTH